ncbi:MAG: indolepyruvate oxidoreductase subunit beta [Clostridiales bacterium]|nr:indolepyruvate oxidoreductase subunit beta [Clostridiales bacterium]
MVKSILIVGVGGQGTLLTSRVVGNALTAAGYDVKISEIHGMAQRGGSVMTFVRYGEKVHSPLIEEAGADVVLAFEKLEALRYVDVVKKDGVMIINTQEIAPMPVVIGNAKYPDDILEQLDKNGVNYETVDATNEALALGNIRVANVILIGKIAKRLDIDKEIWLSAIEKCVPAKTVEINKKAFLSGYEN